MAFIEVTQHGLTGIPAQFIPRLGLCHDGLSERPGDEAALSIVFMHFKFVPFRERDAAGDCRPQGWLLRYGR